MYLQKASSLDEETALLPREVVLVVALSGFHKGAGSSWKRYGLQLYTLGSDEQTTIDQWKLIVQ